MVEGPPDFFFGVVAVGPELVEVLPRFCPIVPGVGLVLVFPVVAVFFGSKL